MMQKLILLDGNSLIYRIYYSLREINNEELEMEKRKFFSIFSSQLRRWVNTYAYHFGIIIFDRHKKSFRNKIYPKYKSNRGEMPENLLSWIPEIISKAREIGLHPEYSPEGFEGDDLIGLAALRFSECGIKVDIFTSDSDFLQLVHYMISVKKIHRGFRIVDHNYNTFKSLNHNLLPFQIPLFKALSGDSSDNYPGIPGIGEKTAINLIQKFMTSENLMNSISQIDNPRLRKSLEENLSNLKIFLELSKIHTDFRFKFVPSNYLIKGEGYSRIR